MLIKNVGIASYEITGYKRGDIPRIIEFFDGLIVSHLHVNDDNLIKFFKYMGFKIEDNVVYINLGTTKAISNGTLAYRRKNVYFQCHSRNSLDLQEMYKNYILKENGPHKKDGTRVELSKKDFMFYKKFFNLMKSRTKIFDKRDGGVYLDDILSDYGHKNGYVDAIVDYDTIEFRGELGRNKFRLGKFLQKKYPDKYQEMLEYEEQLILDFANYKLVVDDDFSTYELDDYSCEFEDPGHFYREHGFKLAKLYLLSRVVARVVVRDKNIFGNFYGIGTVQKEALRITLKRDGYIKVDRLYTNKRKIDPPFLDSELVYKQN